MPAGQVGLSLPTLQEPAHPPRTAHPVAGSRASAGADDGTSGRTSHNFNALIIAAAIVVVGGLMSAAFVVIVIADSLITGGSRSTAGASTDTKAPVVITQGLGGNIHPPGNKSANSHEEIILDQQHNRVADERASRWPSQQLRVTNRKIDSESTVRQVEFDVNRLTSARDLIIRDKSIKIEQLKDDAFRAAVKSDGILPAFGIGVVGALAARELSDNYDKRINQISNDISRLRTNLDEWKAELRRVIELELQLAQWTKLQGHCYPIVQELRTDGVAKNLDIRRGDLFVSYNGKCLAYVLDEELNAPRDEASRNKISTVDVLFARNGRLTRFQVEGGKPLGVVVNVPIRN